MSVDKVLHLFLCDAKHCPERIQLVVRRLDERIARILLLLELCSHARVSKVLGPLRREKAMHPFPLGLNSLHVLRRWRHLPRRLPCVTDTKVPQDLLVEWVRHGRVGALLVNTELVP